MSHQEPAKRQSRKPISKTHINPPSRPRRHVTRPPLIIVSDTDDSDSAYSGPQAPPKKSPQKEDNTPRTPHKTKSKDVGPHAVTPPKQRKQESTPPRTPTVLLQRLSLEGSEEKKNRKKLFEETDVYQSARRALHSSFPTAMPGREKELKELRVFIDDHLKKETSGTMYISGPPGTGKTASLNLILQDSAISDRVKEVYVNCTSIKSSGAIFSRIVKDLGVKAAKTERDCVGAIEGYLKKTHKTILLVLDEIDQLESKNQSVLYTIFEWPANPNFRLILIGISNALDLTDRILPRLEARCELKPQLMHFAPYTKQQIIEICTSRLKNAGVLDIFSPAAIQILAAKVASLSGDLRRALDIARRSIELIDRRQSSVGILKSVENLADLESLPSPKKKEVVNVQQVHSVLTNVYATSQNLDNDIDDAFPLQQKIVVCCLLRSLKKNKDVTVGTLHEEYRKVCSKNNIQVVDQGEFVGLCSLIETRGIMRMIKKKDPRLSKISLVWNEEEVAAAFKDKQLMAMILQDDRSLNKV